MAQINLLGELDTPTSRIERSASFSPKREYRYELLRVWNKAFPILPVCMLNPSTADADRDDPTVKALIHFATLWNYGGIRIVNLFAFCASVPSDMMAAVDPIGPLNLQYIDQTLTKARHSSLPMLAAWGRGGVFQGRAAWLTERAARHMVSLICLGTTLDNAPMHPMARGRNRIPRDQMPIMWRRASEVL